MSKALNKALVILTFLIFSVVPSASAQIQDLTSYEFVGNNLPRVQIRETLISNSNGSLTLYLQAYDANTCTQVFAGTPQPLINANGSNLIPFPSCLSGLAVYNIVNTPVGSIFRHLCAGDPTIGAVDLRNFYSGQYGGVTRLNYTQPGRRC